MDFIRWRRRRERDEDPAGQSAGLGAAQATDLGAARRRLVRRGGEGVERLRGGALGADFGAATRSEEINNYDTMSTS